MGFLENLFAPFGDFYQEYQESVSEEFHGGRSEEPNYEELIEADQWFDVDYVKDEDLDDFVDWWFEYGQYDDEYSWEDFREVYEGD